MSFICIPVRMNLIKAHGGKGSGPFSFERLATSPPQADHVLVDLFFILGRWDVKAPTPWQPPFYTSLRDGNTQVTFKIKLGRFQGEPGNSGLCHMPRITIYKWKCLSGVKGHRTWIVWDTEEKWSTEVHIDWQVFGRQVKKEICFVGYLARVSMSTYIIETFEDKGW